VLKSVFYGRIRVGAKEFSVVFDSGSGHLILPGARCDDRACLSHQQYDPATSLAAVEINSDGTPIVPGSDRDQLTVSFGTGEVSGVFVKDLMCAGAPEEDSDEATVDSCRDVQMIVATKMSDKPFADFAFDGVFGLALPGLSQTSDFNLATQLTKDLPSGMQAFSYYFSHKANGSKLVFGGLLRDRLRSPLVWVPVVDPEDGYWKLRVSGVQIGGERAEICAQGCHGVADTGTSVLAAPTAIIQQIREKFQGLVVREGKCQMPPENASAADFIEVFLDTTALRLYPHDFSQPRRSLEWNGTDVDDWDAEDLPCELMLMRLDVPEPLGPLVVLGEPFLTKYYTVFDVEHLRVGFALANHEADERRPIGASDQLESPCWAPS
jgi:cathepsin D